jgi:hypothetical protein
MEIASIFLVPGIGFILTLVFGFWLTRIGRPYNGILFNIHKLIALGTLIPAAAGFYRMFNALESQSLLIVLIVLAGLCVAALFVSGAFLSIGRMNYRVVKAVHNIALVLLVIAVGSIFYLVP